MQLKFLVAALAAAVSMSAAFAQAPIVIKFSHIVAPNTPKGMAADRFKMVAEKLTGGRVKVEVYANSTLYKDKEELEALQLGAVQMLAPTLGKFGLQLGIKEYEIFDVPYIFPTKQALYNITEGPIGKAMLQKLEAKGMVGLGFWDNGFKVMSSNTPMHMPSDLTGLKMRVQASKVLDAQMRAFGAIPMALSFSETYQALQSGLVDGTENPPSNVLTQRMHEVQKHITLSNHGYIGNAVVVNKKFWDELPVDIRLLLEKALADATTFEKAIAQRDNDLALDIIKKSGKTTVYALTPAEQNAWRAAMAPVRQEMEGRVGKELMAAIARQGR